MTGSRRQRRDASGQLVERKTKRGVVYGLRFVLPERGPDGRRQRVFETLGRSWEGVDRREAEMRAERLRSQAQLGQYRTREQRDAERTEAETQRREMPTFEAFAAEWLARKIRDGGRRGDGLSDAGSDDLRWRLAHLNGWFGPMPLDAITPREVDAYADAKRRAAVGSGGLSPSSLNKTLSVLEAIVRRAVRLEVVTRNPVDGFRVPTGAPKRRPYIDGPDHLAALLAAAGAVDDERVARGLRWRRPFLAMLALGGPRIEEAMNVRRGDLDLGRSRLRIRGTKTDAAERWVPLVPLLADELAVYVAQLPERPADALLFGTSSGRPVGASNVRRRVLAPAVERADAALAEAGDEPLPHLTPHALRRTAASLWFAVGWDLPTVMAALGHASERMTLGVYAKAMRMHEDDRARLRAMVLGETLDDLAAEVTTTKRALAER